MTDLETGRVIGYVTVSYGPDKSGPELDFAGGLYRNLDEALDDRDDQRREAAREHRPETFETCAVTNLEEHEG